MATSVTRRGWDGPFRLSGVFQRPALVIDHLEKIPTEN